ncbi:MAG: hypothetical protein WBE26_04190 [Phycisphaerae bacterium]
MRRVYLVFYYYSEHYVLNMMNAVRGAYLGRTTMIMFNDYRSE